jgi:hypothetical protein
MRSKSDVAALLEQQGAGAFSGMSPDELTAAAEICGEKGDVAALAAMAAWPDKAAAKLARRLLHNMKTRGMAVPESRPKGNPALHPVDDVFATACLVSAFDLAGGRAAFLLRRNPGGGVLAVVLYLDETKGISGANSSVISRKEARAYIAGLKRASDGISVVDVDEEFFRGVLHEAKELTVREGRTLPEDAYKVPKEWFEAPVPTIAEAATRNLPPAGGSDLLYSEPEIMQWFPDRDQVSRMELRVREIETSRILVDEAAKLEHVERYFSEATAEYFTGAVRRRYASRLAWTAVIFDLTGRPAAASMARSAAAWLQDETLSPEGCGFSREYLRRIFVLRPPEVQEPAGAPEEPVAGDRARLIVTPDEFTGGTSRRRG